MNGSLSRQHGQAVVEALLMLPLLAVLAWAVSRIGGLQFSAQELAQASRKAAMAAALGQPLKDLAAAARPGLSGTARPLAGVAPARMAALQDAWFDGGLQLLSVEARQGGPEAPRISRRTHVASGTGHAHGDADAQRRIGRAPDSWRRAESDSLAQARRLKHLIDRMESPWRRARLSLDWLSAWADVVPPDRLGRRGERNK
ncbi:pilus assembly protein TadE [Achromobacter sp. RTa]|uniref:hypothetical protein n=1 Tax=Achromobacter sp. RTa TaxID=1532557 RepID=UPI00050F934B|nr:hypothetical protein [Achromobacter sp. RTa]KGE01520.1 pilus assembly protein TadE [Achromobacter sp. RTa]